MLLDMVTILDRAWLSNQSRPQALLFFPSQSHTIYTLFLGLWLHVEPNSLNLLRMLPIYRLGFHGQYGSLEDM